MWNAGGHRRIGFVDGACTATTADDTRALCNVVYTFRGRGEISTTGVSPLSGAADIDPIVGGDRQFRNVRGQVDFGNSTGTTTRVTLELPPYWRPAVSRNHWNACPSELTMRHRMTL
jgi:hypothetical protein